jgi:hypothetical protein
VRSIQASMARRERGFHMVTTVVFVLAPGATRRRERLRFKTFYLCSSAYFLRYQILILLRFDHTWFSGDMSLQTVVMQSHLPTPTKRRGTLGENALLVMAS